MVSSAGLDHRLSPCLVPRVVLRRVSNSEWSRWRPGRRKGKTRQSRRGVAAAGDSYIVYGSSPCPADRSTPPTECCNQQAAGCGFRCCIPDGNLCNSSAHRLLFRCEDMNQESFPTRATRVLALDQNEGSDVTKQVRINVLSAILSIGLALCYCELADAQRVDT